MPALHRSLIQSLPVFCAMDDPELDDVTGRATALRIPKGSAVFEQGEIATSFYVLLNEMATQDVEHRVAHAVLRLVNQSGRKVQEGVLIDFPVTRQEIAEVSGTTLHSVSRVLSAWENAGLVVVGRRKVIVCDLERLSRIAEESGCER